MSNLRSVQPGLRRSTRAPIFPFGGTLLPFGLYPVFAFPVLPGETVGAVQARGRFISQPLKSPIAGAWMEGWVFEVPLRLINENFFSQLNPSTAGHVAGSQSYRFFTNTGQVTLIQEAYNLVVEYFFTRPGTTPPTVETGITQLPLISTDWMDNLQTMPASLTEANMPENILDTEIVGMSIEDERALIEADDYRQFVQMFGPKDPESQSRPRLRRYFRQWGIPNNVIDPSSGVPRSTHFFDLNWGLRKGFRAQEPAICVCMMAYRPQMQKTVAQGSYLGRMVGTGEWFPPKGQAAWSVINGDDPILPAAWDTGSPAADYIFDRSDVFMRGESFINQSSANNPYPPPTSALGSDADPQAIRGAYCSTAEWQALFANAGVTDRLMYYQGIGSARVGGLVREVADGRSTG